MRKRLALLRRLLADQRGATAIEYALMAAVVSITAISGLQAFAGSMDHVWNVLIAGLAGALAGA
jgi:Flp pilus assembly pilin Flp